MSHSERWAVLIGINLYSESNSGRSNLEGCINDVNDTKLFLQSHLDIQADHIAVLMTDQDSSRSQENWPTRTNVLNAISMVKERAQPGDFLYIHYSGHGDRVFLEDSDGSDDTRCYEVLCTLEGEIKDADFGDLLDALVENGLNVCVVLDCCYAGGASRHGSQTKVRCKTEVLEQPSRRGASKYEAGGAFRPQRDAVHRKGLLYRPRGYNLIAACQPFQPAVEWRSENGQIYGALTFHLIQSLLSLQASTGPITYRMLQEVLEAKCKDLKQQPMHIGDESRVVFQAAKYTPNLTNIITTVERVNGVNVILRKGAAHSVHIGDRFIIHRPSQYSLGFLRRHAVATNEVVVTRVSDLRCDTISMNAKIDDNMIEVGWLAQLSQRAKPMVINVRMAEAEASSDLYSAVKRFQQCCLSDTDENIHIVITVNDHQQNALLTLQHIKEDTIFKILDKNGMEMPYLSPIRMMEKGAAELQDLASLLQHLCYYQEALSITSSSSPFRPKFTFDIVPEAIASGDYLSLAAWRIIFKNNDRGALYITILNFSPAYGIHQILPSDKTSSVAVEPQTHIPLILDMKVPPFLKPYEKSGLRMKDTIKVFVTTEQSTFTPYILPDLKSSNFGRNASVSTEGERRLGKFVRCDTGSFVVFEKDIITVLKKE